MNLSEQNTHRFLIVSMILVLIGSLFLGLIDGGSARYASASQEIIQNGHWFRPPIDLSNYHPLLLWMSTLSFKLLGITSLSFKLPGFVFMLIGIHATFSLTEIYYGERAARMAVIILSTTQIYLLPLIESGPITLLMSISIFSIWQLEAYIRNGRRNHFILGFVGIASAIMAGGLIGLAIPVFVLGSNIILQKKWKVLNWRWLAGFLIIGMILFPLVYGLTDPLESDYISRLRSIFFPQGLGDPLLPFTGLPIYLLALVPWGLLFIRSVTDKIQIFTGKKQEKTPEYLSSIGLLAVFILLISTKQNTLNIIHILSPLGAILTAAYIDKMKHQPEQTLFKIQAFFLFGLWMLSFLFLFYIFTSANVLVTIFVFGFLAITILALFKLPQKKAFIIGTAIWAIAFNFILVTHAYPKLLDYQSGSKLGKWLKEQPATGMNISSFRTHSHAAAFYYGKEINSKKEVNQLSSKDGFLFTDKIGLNTIASADIPFIVIKELDDFDVSKLNWTFLNPKTRRNTLEKRYLIAIYPQVK